MISNYDFVFLFNKTRHLNYIFNLNEIYKKRKVGYIFLNDRERIKTTLKKLFTLMSFDEIKNFNNINTKKLIINVGIYSNKDIEKIKLINAHKKFIYFGLTNPSNLFFKFKKEGLNIDKCIFINKHIFYFRKKLFNEKKIERSKLLFGKIEHKKNKFIENKVNCDYIIAFPTQFSFADQKSKIFFLKNINKLIDSIDPKKKIIIKYHNSQNNIYDLFESKIYIPIYYFFSFIKFSLLFHLIEKKLKVNFFEKIKNIFIIIDYFMKIKKKTQNLNRLTNYHFLSLEIFLPYVTTGLITGQSNSIWHGLNSHLKVYNCALDNYDKKNFINYEKKIHKYFIKFLGIKCCNGNIKYNSNNKKILAISEKKQFLKLI